MKALLLGRTHRLIQVLTQMRNAEDFIPQRKAECCISPTVAAVEVIRVVGIIPIDERLFINDGVTLLTNILAKATSSLTDVAWTTQVSVKG